jgi:SpoVK/Ycf46/Vps4 family AAA+-type ATPase
MDFKNCVKTLIQYSAARIPFISFKTVERARALDVLREVNKNMMLPFNVHALSKGITDLDTDRLVNEDKSVIGALDYVAEQMKRRENQTFIFTEVSDLGTDSSTARYFLDMTTLAVEHGGVIIVLTQDSVWSQLQRTGMTLSLDLPNEEEMLEIIKSEIEPYKNSIRIDWNEEDFREAATILAGVTKVEVSNIVASLIASREIRRVDLDELKFVKNRLFSDISGLEKIDVSDSILEIGGLSGLKNWLDDKSKLQTPSKRKELKERGLQPPRGILLVGVPGCGKSLSAKAIAASWKLPLFRLDFATVQGMYVGQSEQQLKEAFQTAEHVSPCVLWIDEIEKGLGGGGGDGGVTTRLVGQFLFWMQECKKLVFVVATANDVSKLPSELLRRGRFDELFFVDLPNHEERADILGLYIKKYLEMPFTETAMKKFVAATEGFTGADLESSIRDLAYRKIANESLTLDEELVLTSLKNVIPLSQTSPEKIEEIREWGREKAVPASGRPIGAISSENAPVEKRGRQVLI